MNKGYSITLSLTQLVKNIMTRILLLNLLFLVLLPVHAEDEHAHTHEESYVSHEAHVHGEAEMTIIIQGGDIAIEFKTPAVNLLGFEHEPESDLQRNKLDVAILDLQDPSSWLQFNGGDCQLTSTNAGSTFGDAAPQEHNSLYSDYVYRCQQPQSLKSLSVLISTSYPGVEHIDVQWIKSGEQGSEELSHNKTQLTF